MEAEVNCAFSSNCEFIVPHLVNCVPVCVFVRVCACVCICACAHLGVC